MSLYGLFYRLFIIVTGLIPYRALYQIGKLMGWIFYLTPNKHKRISLENLNLVFPELTSKELNKLLRESLFHSSMNILECGMVWGSKKYIKDKYFLMLLPDDLIIKKNCSKSMINTHNKYKASVMASMSVNKKAVSRWGIYKLNKKLNKNDYLIKGVIEKPKVKDAPSSKAIIGRYILPRSIFNKLKNTKPSKEGEIHITDAIQALIKDKEKFIAHNFLGKFLDCGTMQGYIKSTLEINKS